MLTRRILGLDLGSHAAKAVELRQTLRGVEVVQLRHLPLPDPSADLGQTLAELIQGHDLPRENVVVGLAGDRISSRRLSFPFKDRKKIGAAVPFELEGQVPFELDDYFVDWEITGQRVLEPATGTLTVGHWRDGEMHLTFTTQDGSDTVQHRVRFFEITPESFEWEWQQQLAAGADWIPFTTLSARRMPGA